MPVWPKRKPKPGWLVRRSGPQLGAGANGSKRKQNFVGLPIPGRDPDQVLTSESTSFGVDLTASWEADLWGRLRAGAQAALADADAAAADFRAAHLSLAAQTARAYFAAVEAGSPSRASAGDRCKLPALRRADRGPLSPRPCARRSTCAWAGRAWLRPKRPSPQRRQQRDAVLRQLELLLGRYPSARIEVGGELPAIGGPVPAGLPAQLVSRRPDLVAAERRLTAADRRLAQARRSLLPRISLTASTGRSSSALSDLLDGDFSVWNLVGNIAQPLLQGGRLRAGVDQAASAAEQALFAYAQSALRAYGEVEAALNAEGFLADQERALTTAAEEAVAARALAEERYARGLADLIALLESQRRAFDAESRLLAIRRQRLDTRIDLHLALGGGFTQPAEIQQ